MSVILKRADEPDDQGWFFILSGSGTITWLWDFSTIEALQDAGDLAIEVCRVPWPTIDHYIRYGWIGDAQPPMGYTQFKRCGDPWLFEGQQVNQSEASPFWYIPPQNP